MKKTEKNVDMPSKKQPKTQLRQKKVKPLHIDNQQNIDDKQKKDVKSFVKPKKSCNFAHSKNETSYLKKTIRKPM